MHRCPDCDCVCFCNGDTANEQTHDKDIVDNCNCCLDDDKDAIDDNIDFEEEI